MVPESCPVSPSLAQRELSLAAQLLLGGVRGYQLMLRPWIGMQCRFTPSCSDYALQALRVHGAWRGARLSAARIGRCNPWCDGGHDPVPAEGGTSSTGYTDQGARL